MKPTKEQNDFDAFVAWTRARVLRTSGDLGRADVAEQEARWAVENHAPGFVAFVQLLDTNMATPDIARAAADLEAERAAHARTRRELGQLVLDAQNAVLSEQAAHAETRLKLDVESESVKRLSASNTAWADRAADAVNGLRVAWSTATGCSTPEEYTRRAEGEEDENAPAPMTDAEAHADGLCDLGPGGPCNECNRGAAYQTKRLAAVAFGAFSRAKSFGDDDEKAWQYVVTRVLQTYQNDTRAEPTDEQVGQLERMVVHSGASTLRDVIRAVLRSLPAPTLPSEDEIRASLPPSLVALFDEGRSRMLIRAVHDLMRKRGFSAPPSDEQLAEEAARAHQMADNWGWPYGAFADGYAAGARREGRR